MVEILVIILRNVWTAPIYVCYGHLQSPPFDESKPHSSCRGSSWASVTVCWAVGRVGGADVNSFRSIHDDDGACEEAQLTFEFMKTSGEQSQNIQMHQHL